MQWVEYIPLLVKQICANDYPMTLVNKCEKELKIGKESKRDSTHKTKKMLQASHLSVTYLKVFVIWNKKGSQGLTRSDFWTLYLVTALSSSGVRMLGWKVDGSCLSRTCLNIPTKMISRAASKSWKKGWKALHVSTKTYRRVYWERVFLDIPSACCTRCEVVVLDT